MFSPNDNPPLIQITNPQDPVIRTGAASRFVEWTAGDAETETSRLTYQYKVNDDAWSNPTRLTFTTLTELDDGENILSVRAVDRDRNKSEPATRVIMVDTIRPNVLIADPTPDAIVGRTVPIKGGVTDTDLVEFQVEYAAGEEPADVDYTPIGGKSTSPVKFGSLGALDTTSPYASS